MGWSKWFLTKPGEDLQGWIRFYDNRMDYHNIRQVIFRTKKEKWAIVLTDENDHQTYYPQHTTTDSEARRLAEQITVEDLISGQPEFDYSFKEEIDDVFTNR